MVKVVLVSVVDRVGAPPAASTQQTSRCRRLVGELRRAVRRHGRLPGREARRGVLGFRARPTRRTAWRVIAFTPANTPGRVDLYVVRQMAGSGSQVIWRRPGNVGGLDWLDGEARSRADRCGNS